jgi:hypothetical protein
MTWRAAFSCPSPKVCAAAVAEFSDDYFKRSAEDIQADFKRAAAKRESDTTFSTRAWKERNMGGDEAAKRSAVIRVRMPDGTQLQGRAVKVEPMQPMSTAPETCASHML